MKYRKFQGNPMFSSKTLIYNVFTMAMKGTTLSKIEYVCKKKGSVGAARLIRILRSGQHYGRTWAVEERDGHIKVTPNTEVIPRQKRKRKSKV